MWGQTFYTLTPTLQTLTCVHLRFLKPLLNTAFRSSWCLGPGIFGWLCHEPSHHRPTQKWNVQRLGNSSGILQQDLCHCMYNITKLTHHFIYQWGNLLGKWCGIRCQADMGVGCMVIGVSHINIGIAFVLLSTLANCWIVKFPGPVINLITDNGSTSKQLPV